MTKTLKAILSLTLLILQLTIVNAQNIYNVNDEDLLANGKKFQFWEVTQKYTKTYYVSQNEPNASDDNVGSESNPFKTISKAASILQPSERVIIKAGVYYETINPANSGTSPDKMITYQAAPNEKVIVSGAADLNPAKWEIGTRWSYGKSMQKDSFEVYEYDLSEIEFKGYNPFGMMNILHDREWLQYREKVNMWPHFKRRGMVFCNGILLEQVENQPDLKSKAGTFWVEHNGLIIHVRFPDNKKPTEFKTEITVKEQLFVPKKHGFGYIKLDGIHFTHVGNGFPVPQRGMISTARGHHWIIENCTIEWANSVGIDMGLEMWGTRNDGLTIGYHVVRNNVIKNCGISGLQGMSAKSMLIEDNLFDNIGWQDAELAFESGGIKLHQTSNTLIRRNVIRNIFTAPGIWLDYQSNDNCRITKNVISNINTARGGIYVEASQSHCRIDHNVFHKITSRYWLSGDYGAGGSALYTDGSDSIYFDHNLILDAENSGYGAYLNATRIVGERGGITRWHSVTDNVFAKCGKYFIEFANEYNFSNNNIFSAPAKGGYLTIGNPLPALFLDIVAVQKMYGWEKTGLVLKNTNKIEFDLKTDALLLTIKYPVNDTMKKMNAGPFVHLNDMINIDIDPRKKY